MRRLPWAALVFVVSGACMALTFAGCGSDSNPDIPADGGDENANVTPPPNPPPPDTDTGAPDADVGDVVLDGMRDPDANIQCTAKGSACTTSVECCTANCASVDGGAKTCADPVTLCKTPGMTCTLGNECCTGTCTSGTCSSTLCEPDGLSCAVAGDCCSQYCAPQAGGGGKCTTLSPTGKPTSGNPCTTNSQCASGWCNNGVCSNPSFCTVDGDICSSDAQCCGGLCSKVAGASVGYCKNVAVNTVGGTCLPAGELCSPNGTCTGASCCSRSCAPSPTSGLGVCQPESGCRIIGDLCTTTSECCGVVNQPGSIKGVDDGGTTGGPSTDVQCQKQAGQTYGTCNYVTTVCSPAGSLCKPGLGTLGGATSCSTKADCCAGNDNTTPSCQIDANGIPRCVIRPGACDAGAPAAGTACASTADCCGNPCIPNPNGTSPAYVCGTPGSCQKQGMSCTSSADCCSGLPCAIPPGATGGICGGTVLSDGGVTDAAPPGTDGGTVTQDAGDGGTTTCALYGQSCTVDSNCCSGVPCTLGTCHFP